MIIFLNNLYRIFKKRTSLVFMIILPIVLNAVLISMYNTGETATLGITIHENTRLTSDLHTLFEEKYELLELNEDEINDAIIDGRVDCVVVINEGFTDAIMRGEETTFDFYMLQESNVSAPIKIFLNSTCNALNVFGEACEGDKQIFYEMFDEYMNGKFGIEFKYFDDSFERREIAIRSLGYLTLGLMFFVGMATTSILMDKEENVYTRVMVSPLKRSSYILQNILSYVVLSVIQIAALFFIMVNFLNVDFGGRTYECFAISLLFSMVCISLGVLISSFCKKVSTANALTSLINVPMLMLGGCFWHIDMMPESMQAIGKCLPTYWYITSCERILTNESFGSYSLYIILMFAFSALLVIVSAIYSKYAKVK